MDQLRAPVIQLPEEPPTFAVDQPSERRFIYLHPPHMNVIITPARPPGVGCGGRVGAPLLHFALAPPLPPPPPTVSVDLLPLFPSDRLLQVLKPKEGSLLSHHCRGGGWGASE